MYKKESESSRGALKWSTYYSPLHPLSWIAAISTGLFHALGNMVLLLILNKEMEEESMNQSWWWTGFHGFVGQGTPTEPSSLSARFGFWMLFVNGWLLWASHSATLSSRLAVKIDRVPFTSIADMLRNTDFKIMFTEGSSEIDQFKVRRPN